MNTLKWKTVSRYSARQLYKHIDRFQDAHDVDEFRIDWHYGDVWSKDHQRRWSGLTNASYGSAIEALYRVYRSAGLIPGVDFEDYDSNRY